MATPADAAQFDVWRDGERFELRGTALLAVEPRVAWEVLTDHERLPEFIDAIDRSRVVERRGSQAVVEHVGVLRVLLFTMPVRVRLAVTEQPYERVRAARAPGSVDGQAQTLRVFDGSYTLTVVTVERRAGVRIDYRAHLELAEPLPPVIDPLFGRTLVAHAGRRHFDALLREIERRQREKRRQPS